MYNIILDFFYNYENIFTFIVFGSAPRIAKKSGARPTCASIAPGAGFGVEIGRPSQVYNETKPFLVIIASWFRVNFKPIMGESMRSTEIGVFHPGGVYR